jgi:tetratricopeptide (TPR) repeat protein
MQWFLAALGEDKPRDEAALRRAIHHLQAALRVFTKQHHPYFWASVHMNLGNIYSDLPYTAGNGKRAISRLEKALEIYTEANHPHEFGLVQMLLGKTYKKIADHKDSTTEQAKLILRAIACYEAAARGFTHNREFSEIALSLSLAGLSCQSIPTGNKREHLRRSANYFVKAAQLFGQNEEVSMQANHYLMAGEVLLKLAGLTRMSNEVIEARDAYLKGQELYERSGQKDEAAKAGETARELEAFLETVSS